MTRITASCATCGDTQLTRRDVAVVTVNGQHSYRFRCPRCRSIVIKGCDPHAAAVLAAAGVTQHTIDVTADPHDDGPPLTWDDLLDTHQAWTSDLLFWADLENATAS